jgi:hypothetical protein
LLECHVIAVHVRDDAPHGAGRRLV